MIFTKADRERLERIDKRLLDEELAYIKRCKTNDDRWRGMEDKLDLLALNQRRVCEAFDSLSGKLDGIRDGLASELGEIGKLIQQDGVWQDAQLVTIVAQLDKLLSRKPKPRRSQPRKRK